MLTFIESSEIQWLLKMFFPTGRVSWKSLDKGLLNQNLEVKHGGKRFLLKIYRPEVTEKDLHECVSV
jgi:Ser/Thr protein kinase RdoA (MazF antagonist)